MSSIDLPEGSRILVVALRRIGDVLLTTPLIRSVRHAFAQVAIDALVFSGTEGVLQGNPDLDRVIAMPARATVTESYTVARSIWRRYRLAIATQTGDRPIFFAWAAAPMRVGPVEAHGMRSAFGRAVLNRTIEAATDVHRVTETLRLADLLGIAPTSDVVLPTGPVRPEFRPDGPYAIVHAVPMFTYKRWVSDGWREVAATLARRGLAVIATGGPDPQERRYLDEVWGEGDRDARRLDGKLTWPELAALIAAARVYVGPDTSVTHLAAASGAPTVALYGPTNPRRWGPWPAGGLREGWVGRDAIQRRHNVWLVQNPLHCVPCQHEGCERRLDSYSRCLDELTVVPVLRAVEEALAWSEVRSA